MQTSSFRRRGSSIVNSLTDSLSLTLVVLGLLLIGTGLAMGEGTVAGLLALQGILISASAAVAYLVIWFNKPN